MPVRVHTNAGAARISDTTPAAAVLLLPPPHGATRRSPGLTRSARAAVGALPGFDGAGLKAKQWMALRSNDIAPSPM